MRPPDSGGLFFTGTLFGQKILGRMMNNSTRLGVSVLLCLLTGAGYGEAEDLPGALQDCRMLAGRDARLACYDGLADSLAIRRTVPETAPEVVAAPTVASPPPAPAVPEKTVEQPAGESEFGRPPEKTAAPDAIVVGIRAIDRTAFGKLILTLDNGQVWQQLDSRRTTLRAGDEVRIASAMSGSFLLQKASGGSSIRVKRIDS